MNHGSTIPSIRLRYFYQDLSGIVWSKHEITVANTGGAPSVWYNTAAEKWYLARVLRDSSGVQVLSSSNGVSFTTEEGLGFSITSPVAGGVFAGQEVGLVLTRP